MSVARRGWQGDVEAALVRAAVPLGCSDAIPVAPAAGPSVVFRPVEVVQTDSGPRVRSTSAAGAHPVRRCGPLEVMERMSARRGGAGLVFTPAQHSAAFEYVALVERCAASGVKLSSIEGGGGGGGGDVVGRMDRICRDLARLRSMRAVVGHGLALAPRGARAHADRNRRAVSVLAVVDGLLIEGRSASEVLVRYGWSRQTPYLHAVQEALGAALTRMYGR